MLGPNAQTHTLNQNRKKLKIRSYHNNCDKLTNHSMLDEMT